MIRLSSPTDDPLKISAVGVVRFAIGLTPRLQFGTKGAFTSQKPAIQPLCSLFCLARTLFNDRLSGGLSLKMISHQGPSRIMRAAYIAKVGFGSPWRAKRFDTDPKQAR